MKHIVIWGNTPRALNAYQFLKPALKRGDVKVTIISEHNYYYYSQLAPYLITGLIAPHQAIDSIRRLAKLATVYIANVLHVDYGRKRIHLFNNINGHTDYVAFDLLLADPSLTVNDAAYGGANEHVFNCLNYDNSVNLRNHLITMLELSDGNADTNMNEINTFMRFVVNGADLQGVQTALHLREYQQDLIKREYKGINPDACEVVLIANEMPLLATFQNFAGYKNLVAQIEILLREKNIRYLPQRKVKAVTPHHVILNDETRLESHTLIDTINYQMANLFDDEQDNVFLLPDPGDHEQLQTILNNIAEGTNVIRKTPDFIGLGTTHWLKISSADIQIKNSSLMKITRANIGQIASWDRRVRFIVDLLIRQATGRDIVAMNIHKPTDFSVQYVHAEPGSQILLENTHNLYHHIILEGRIEIRQNNQCHDVLSVGDSFGSAANMTAVAQEQSHLLKIPSEQLDDFMLIANALSGEQKDF